MLAFYERTKIRERKMTTDYHWIGAEEDIGMFRTSREMMVTALFTFQCLEDKLGLCSVNCHIQAMTENYSARLRVFANLMRVVSE